MKLLVGFAIEILKSDLFCTYSYFVPILFSTYSVPYNITFKLHFQHSILFTLTIHFTSPYSVPVPVPTSSCMFI